MIIETLIFFVVVALVIAFIYIYNLWVENEDKTIKLSIYKWKEDIEKNKRIIDTFRRERTELINSGEVDEAKEMEDEIFILYDENIKLLENIEKYKRMLKFRGIDS
jgi:hypothetical protein